MVLDEEEKTNQQFQASVRCHPSVLDAEEQSMTSSYSGKPPSSVIERS